MVGGDIARFAPDPRDVNRALAVHARLPISVAVIFAADEIGVRLSPGFGFEVVPIDDQIAAPAGAVAVHEDQIAVGHLEKLGVGDVLFRLAGHGHGVAEIRLAGRFGAGVAQRIAVMIPREVQIAVAVGDERDVVVGVLHVSVQSRHGGLPIGFTELSLGDDDIALLVVIGRELLIAGRGDRIIAEDGDIHRIPRPRLPDRHDGEILGPGVC